MEAIHAKPLHIYFSFLKKNNKLKKLKKALTTVEILRFPRAALIRHLYSLGSGREPVRGFGLLCPSTANTICGNYTLSFES
jgi:hypothetical protein